MTIHERSQGRSVYLKAQGREAAYARLPPHPLIKRYVARPMPRGHLAPMLQRAADAVPVLATQLSVENVYDRDPRSFWGFWRHGEAPGASPGGLTAILLLSTEGAAQLLAGTLDFRDPQPGTLVEPQEAPTAIYIWLMYAPGRISGALFSLFEEMNRPPYDRADIYWRPVTAAGRRLTQPFGFELFDGQAKISNLHKIARGGLIETPAEPARVRENPEPSQAATPAEAAPQCKQAVERQQAVSVTVARSMDDILRAVAIRAAVFMAEQVCPYDEEFDGNDFCATHLVANVDGEPAACIRLRFFGDFAKIERMAVRKEYRKSRAIFRLIAFTLQFCRRKGYARVYGHVQERLLGFWGRFGAKPMPGRSEFVFSDHRYVEMVVELGEAPNALKLGCAPHLLNRPEGEWDMPGVLERSSQRGASRSGSGPSVMPLDRARSVD